MSNSDRLAKFEAVGKDLARKMCDAGFNDAQVRVACHALLMAAAGNRLAAHPANYPETPERHREKAKRGPVFGPWSNPTHAGQAGVEDYLRSLRESKVVDRL